MIPIEKPEVLLEALPYIPLRRQGAGHQVRRARDGKTGDLGFVGEVVGVNRDVIDSLQRFIPVIPPVAADLDGVT